MTKPAPVPPTEAPWKDVAPMIALATVLLGALVTFLGVTFEQARLARLGLPVGIVGTDKITAGVDGTITLVEFLAESGKIVVLLLLTIAFFCLMGVATAWIVARTRAKAAKHNRRDVDVAARVYGVAGLAAFAIILPLLAGPRVGREDAEFRISQVREGAGFDFPTRTGSVHGIAVAGTSERIWVLSKDGLHGVAMGDLTGPIRGM